MAEGEGRSWRKLLTDIQTHNHSLTKRRSLLLLFPDLQFVVVQITEVSGFSI